jgi:type II secretory pathway component PulF
MTTQPSRPPVAALVWGVLVPVVLWAAVIAGLLIVIPRYQRRYQELGLSLPSYTENAVEAANWVNNYWYVALIWVLIFLPSGTLVTVAIGRRSGRWLSRLWVGLMIALPFVASALLVYAIYLADERLNQVVAP